MNASLIAASMNLLVRSSPNENNPDRANDDLQIEPDRIILDVIQIVLGVQVHGLVTPAVDLPPPCQTGWHRKTLSLPRLILIDEIRHFRTGTYETHRPSQDVEKLREFIQAEAAEQSSRPRDPRIILHFMDKIPLQVQLLYFGFSLLCILDHGPEFQHFENAAVLPHPFLAKQYRAPVLKKHQKRR